MIDHRAFIPLFVFASLVYGINGMETHGDLRHTAKIVGGHPETRADVVAWQAVILRNNQVHCGGSVISFNKVLTAAHCALSKNHGELTLLIGSGELSKGRQYQIVRMYKHDNFHRGAHDVPIDDVMIIEFYNKKRSIVLNYPKINDDHSTTTVRSSAFISGFGQTMRNGVSSDALLTARVPIMDPAYCMRAYGGISMNQSICAGNSVTDSCQGDSGGGLWIRDARNRSKILILGVVSYGAGCAAFKSPGVYVQISMYQTWIADILSMPPTPFLGTFKVTLAISGIAGAALVVAIVISVIIFVKVRRSKNDKSVPNFQA